VTIIELLLKTNIDVNDIDAEGNSALHWSLKASPQQMKSLSLSLSLSLSYTQTHAQ
jgi:ankyrin repeat protein